MNRASRAPLLVRLAPLGLIVVAEAAWIAIVGGLIQEYSLRAPVLGVVELGAFVLLGAIAANVLARRLRPGRWAVASILIVAAGTLAGILAAPDARAALEGPGGGLAAAVARHPGGLVAGLAVFRGFRHARLPLDEDALRHLFAGGAVVAIFGSLAGTLVAEPFRDRFLSDALGQVVLFAVTAVLGLALTRQLTAELEGAERWTPNTSWLGLVAIVVAITGFAVVPASTIASPLVELAIYLLLAALLVVGALIGWTRQTVAGLIAVVVVFVVIGIFLSMSPPESADPGSIGAGGGLPTGGDGGSGASAASAIPIEVVYGLAVVLVALIVGALAWYWAQGRGLAVVAPALETRFIDRSRGNEPSRPAPGWLARLGIHLSPGDAPNAYLALIRELAGKVGVERDAAETPREHAHRLRTSGTPALGLELLAADYALARFAGERLTPREHRRGVDRWRALRLRLSARSEEIRATAAAIELEKLDRGQRFERTMTGAAQPGDAPPSDVTPHG
jgi:Domain of unknown function (DUF4129)